MIFHETTALHFTQGDFLFRKFKNAKLYSLKIQIKHKLILHEMTALHFIQGDFLFRKSFEKKYNKLYSNKTCKKIKNSP